jgi:5-methylcytosine-specific restriction endonuclease McrA
MRPINKGIWPLDPVGNKIVFNGWGEAKPYLIERTCRYCHFCEMPILNSPAVEHIKNKQYYPNVKNHWANLMLICTYCNSRKPKK